MIKQDKDEESEQKNYGCSITNDKGIDEIISDDPQIDP